MIRRIAGRKGSQGKQKSRGNGLTIVQPIIRYDAIIEAALNGTLRPAYTADNHAAASTTLRKTGFIPRVPPIPAGPVVLVNENEVNLLTRQACQRAEHATRTTKTTGIELRTGNMQERAQADADATALFKESRLRRIVPGFYAGVHEQ